MPEEMPTEPSVSAEPMEPKIETTEPFVPEEPPVESPVEPSFEPPMESSPAPKKNSGAFWIILLAILAVLGIGFGIYAWFFRPADKLSTTRPEQKECPTCPTCTENETECPACEKCETAEEAYRKYADGLLNYDKNARIATSGELYKSDGVAVSAVAIINESNKLSISLGGVAPDSKTDVDTDVVDVFSVNLGNGFGEYFIYTKADGSVYKINLLNSETGTFVEAAQIQPVKIESVSRVVRIIQGLSENFRYPIAVDIDGNVTGLNLE